MQVKAEQQSVLCMFSCVLAGSQNFLFIMDAEAFVNTHPLICSPVQCISRLFKETLFLQCVMHLSSLRLFFLSKSFLNSTLRAQVRTRTCFVLIELLPNPPNLMKQTLTLIYEANYIFHYHEIKGMSQKWLNT